MDYLPLFHNIRNKPCLLVGGGTIALRKARLLCKAGADVLVVAPTVCDELKTLVTDNEGACLFEPYKESHLDKVVLVISATDIENVNRQVALDCEKRSLPVNVVDNPSLCSVIMPAIVDRSPLIMAAASGGEAPVLSRLVRTKLESFFPGSYGRLAQFASRLRSSAKKGFATEDLRSRFWESVLNGPIAEQVLRGNETLAEQEIQKQLDNSMVSQDGEVYLVGAGPGDPDLLTFKALRLMQQAEVVLYDRLVSEPILDMVRRDADRIYVGKKRSQHAVPQGDINQMLVDLALQGKRVLRLKGGDPFIFGRGGEEIDLLAQNKVPFQVVPGITAASGCACYAGIPLTHRDHAQSVRFLTGHLKADGQDIQWQDLVSQEQTLVVYMGLMGAQTISEALISHGKDPETPVALVEKGTTPQQKVYVTSLAQLTAYVNSHDIHAPTLLIIGHVVRLHKSLSWFHPQ